MKHPDQSTPISASMVKAVRPNPGRARPDGINWDYIVSKVIPYREAETLEMKDTILFLMGYAAHIIRPNEVEVIKQRNDYLYRYRLTPAQRQHIVNFLRTYNDVFENISTHE